jgi:integrase
MKLTAASVAALALPEGIAERIYFDDEVAGFGVRVRRSGSKVWVAQYAVGGRTRRLTFGSIKILDPVRARATARTIFARVRLGEDPARDKAAQRARASETFASFLPRYLQRQQQRLRPTSFREISRYLNQYAKAWHARPVTELTRRDSAILLNEIAEVHGAVSANRARDGLQSFFGWLIAEGITDSSPVAFTNKQPENGPRQRVLNDAEILAVWNAASDCNGDFAAIIKLLILTGLRRSEIGGLLWSEFDQGTGLITIGAGRSKNHRSHQVPLSRFARDIFENRPRTRPHVFGLREGGNGYGGWRQAIPALHRRMADAGVVMEPWSLHDLRRSTATGMAELGVEPHVIEACLNHVTGLGSSIARTYNTSSYLPQKTVALQKWSDHIEALVSGKAATVIELPRRR